MYIYISYNGEILCNTLPQDLLIELQTCKVECEYKLCPIRNQHKRHGKRILDNGEVYLCSYDLSVTNKIFKRHLTLCETMFDSLIEIRTSVREKESDKIARLEHNIVTYHKKIQDEMDEILPLDNINIKNWRDALASIKNRLTEDQDRIAMSLLHILKDIKLIKAELDVFELFDCEHIKLNLDVHKIHKVVNLAMQAFWIDFINRKIKVNIGSCNEDVLIDYTSFSVVLGHLFDNATKYVLDNSDINISFVRNGDILTMNMYMTSIMVEPDEIEAIFREKYSGKWSTYSSLSGYGIGMYYVKKITELNGGTIEFIRGEKRFLLQNIPYADNLIKIYLRCA